MNKNTKYSQWVDDNIEQLSKDNFTKEEIMRMKNVKKIGTVKTSILIL